MQMQSSERVAATTIWFAPSRIAVLMALPCSRCQLMFSIVTVASSTSIPTARAKPPKVITLIVSPSAASTGSAARIDSGIDTEIMRVERQLPRNRRIINPVNPAAITPSRMTENTESFTNPD
jgi:hypothetical protein